jgi:hypothetical protein
MKRYLLSLAISAFFASALFAQGGVSIESVEWFYPEGCDISSIRSLAGVRRGMEFDSPQALEEWVGLLNDSLAADPAAGIGSLAVALPQAGAAGAYRLVVRVAGYFGPLDFIALPRAQAISGARPRALSGDQAFFVKGLSSDGARSLRLAAELGISDGVLYGLPSAAWGSVFADEGDLSAYFGIQAAIGYERYNNGMSDKNAFLDFGFAFLGQEPMPWLLGAKAWYDLDQSKQPSASLAFYTAPFDFGELPLAFSSSLKLNYSSATTRTWLDAKAIARVGVLSRIEGLAEGFEAEAVFGVGLDLNSAELSWETTAQARWAKRLGVRLGFDTALAFSAASTISDEWATELRGVSDGQRPITGYGALLWKAQAPLTLARGRLFLNDALPVHVTLFPFADLAYVLAEDRPAIDLSNLFLSAGGELNMTIDSRRLDYLRISAGWDLREALLGIAPTPDTANLEVTVALGLFF